MPARLGFGAGRHEPLGVEHYAGSGQPGLILGVGAGLAEAAEASIGLGGIPIEVGAGEFAHAAI